MLYAAGMTTVGYVSPSTIQLPMEVQELLPPSVNIVASVLDVRAHTDEQFRAAREKLEGVVASLAGEGAQAVVVDGVPVAIWDGYEAEREMWRGMSTRVGVPINSGIGAAVEGFRHLGVGKLVVATAYLPAINDRLASYLQQAGFEVLGIDGLAVHSPAEAARLDPTAYAALAGQLVEAQPAAEGILLGGRGNLVSVAVELEHALDRVVLTARQGSAWWVLRTLDVRHGQGRLLATLG
jgi:arylmalonate decarboxylase